MTGAARWRGRVEYAVREHAEAWLPGSFTDMSNRDRQRWASARTMDDLGELVIAWLEGEIRQTPGHCAPPCDETIPLIPALTLANRAGFITDCSQLAESWQGSTWNTWVSGFATDTTLADLREAVRGTPLNLGACRRREHGCQRMRHLMRFCLWQECLDLWSDRCPDAAGDLDDCWYVTIEDPQPGRNDVLWPALERFAQEAGTAATPWRAS